MTDTAPWDVASPGDGRHRPTRAYPRRASRTTRYRLTAARSSCRYGGRRAGRVIRDIVWATVARDQRDPDEAIAAWTAFTVSTGPPPPATSASTAAAASSRQVAWPGFRSPR